MTLKTGGFPVESFLFLLVLFSLSNILKLPFNTLCFQNVLALLNLVLLDVLFFLLSGHVWKRIERPSIGPATASKINGHETEPRRPNQNLQDVTAQEYINNKE